MYILFFLITLITTTIPMLGMKDKLPSIKELLDQPINENTTLPNMSLWIRKPINNNTILPSISQLVNLTHKTGVIDQNIGITKKQTSTIVNKIILNNTINVTVQPANVYIVNKTKALVKNQPKNTVEPKLKGITKPLKWSTTTFGGIEKLPKERVKSPKVSAGPINNISTEQKTVRDFLRRDFKKVDPNPQKAFMKTIRNNKSDNPQNNSNSSSN